MSRLFSTPFLLFILAGCLMSCSSYKQNIMFRVSDEAALKSRIQEAEKVYTLQANDVFTMNVYANGGERLIDPEFQLSKEGGERQMEPQKFTLNENGLARLPMVGDIQLAGLTLRQAEELLQEEYAKFYKGPYIRLAYDSKRVIILGASGGQIVPLTYNSTRLVEVLALAKGITNDAKAHNIRVLRGSDVMVADLSTIEGYQKHNITMQSGDVVYIEPVRKPLAETLRDYSPFVTVFTSLTTLIIVLGGL